MTINTKFPQNGADTPSTSPANSPHNEGVTASIQISYLSYNVNMTVTRKMLKNLLSTFGNVVDVVMKKQVHIQYY
jgi:hypothetical protein